MNQELKMAEACELDAEGARAQGDRYRRLSEYAVAVTRSPRTLTARFSPEVDQELVAEAVAIEQGCCSFFAIDHDSEALVLSIGVDEDRLAPALDGIESALRGR